MFYTYEQPPQLMFLNDTWYCFMICSVIFQNDICMKNFPPICWRIRQKLNRTFQKMLKFFHIPFFSLFLSNLYIACKYLVAFIYATHFFTIWVFFYGHSPFTGQQEKRECIYLTPLYHLHLFHRYLDISQGNWCGELTSAHS